MNFFNPQPTTPDASTRSYTATLSDRLTIGSGLLENTFSATRFDARVWGQGSQDLIMSPAGNTGSYFAQQARNASRLSLAPVFSFGSINWLGTHSFKVGSYMAEGTDNGRVTEHPIDLLNSVSQLIKSIAFTGGQPFRRWDTEYAFFGQDHWVLTPRLSVDLGVRTESQQVSESFRVAPRAGVAWNILPSAGTVIRAGFGLFYDRVPLNVYAFNQYPSQAITIFNANGQIAAGPFLYQNSLGTSDARYPFVFQESVAGNFSHCRTVIRPGTSRRTGDSFQLCRGVAKAAQEGRSSPARSPKKHPPTFNCPELSLLWQRCAARGWQWHGPDADLAQGRLVPTR